MKTAILFFFITTIAINAQQRKVGINNLSWLAGYWSGEKWDGIIEEIWAPAEGNSMIGMFRFVKDGKISFTELCYLVEENDSVNLKLKHFDYNLHGWEEKSKTVDFKFIKSGINEIEFEGLSMKLLDENTLRARVLLQNKKTGEEKLEDFIYKRKKLESN